MQSTNKKILLVAIVFAVLAALVAFRYLKGLESKVIDESREEVVIVVRDVPARTVITGDMLSLAQIAKGARHPDAALSIEQLIGQITVQPLVAGEQVLMARIFSSVDKSGLSYQIPAGYRAVSVGINSRISVNYFIRPGDYVDIVASFDLPMPDRQDPTKENREQYSYMILQRVAVLAIGQDLRPGVVASPDAETITLAVMPQDAEKLIWAEDYGKIRLILRPTPETRTVVTDGITARDLEAPR